MGIELFKVLEKEGGFFDIIWISGKYFSGNFVIFIDEEGMCKKKRWGEISE